MFRPLFTILALLLLVSCSADPAAKRGRVYDLKADPTDKNVAQRRRLLADENGEVRATALHALVEVQVPDAAKLATVGLDDPHPFVRATAAKLIGDLGHAAAVPGLAAGVREDPHPITRQRCVEALEGFAGVDPAALAGLRLALEDPIKNVRLAAVRAVVRTDPACCVDRLSRMVLEDAEWEIRAQAARGLALSGDPAAPAALDAATRDENEFVRAAARNAQELFGALPPRSAPAAPEEEDELRHGNALGQLGR